MKDEMRDAARVLFCKYLSPTHDDPNRVSYDNLGRGDLTGLMTYLSRSLIANNEARPDFPLHLSGAFKYKLTDTNAIKQAFVFVDGSYFDKRECISFNHDGFIGFCGWADDLYTMPIVRGFRTWVDELAGIDDPVTKEMWHETGIR